MRPARSTSTLRRRAGHALVCTSVGAAALAAFAAPGARSTGAAGDAAPTATTGLIVEWAPTTARASSTTSAREGGAAPLDAATSAAAADRLLADHAAPFAAGAALTGRWQVLRPVRPLAPADLRAWAEALRHDPRVRAVMPDAREPRLDVVPSDPRFGEQWWLQAVSTANAGVAGFTRAWDRSTGAPVSGAAPIVAVLDSGITPHPELDSRRLPGWDFVSDATYAADGDGRDADPADPGDALTAADQAALPDKFGGCARSPTSSWHGTLIAGQVAAVTNEGQGVAAANWNGRFVPVRVAGKCGAAVSDIVDGMRWAAGLAVPGVPANPQPARVIVLGYGGVDACDTASPTPEIAATARLYTDAIAEVRAAGALVVVAAGNQRGAVGRPAGCSGAFAVASLNRQGFKSNYSNFGAGIALATPGGDADAGNTCDAQLADTGIVSTGNLGEITPGAAGYAAGSGTSFAAPAVAAVGSLMLALNPTLTPAELEEGLRRSARPHVLVPLLGDCAPDANAARCACTTQTCGAGVLDADQALAYAVAPQTYVAPSRTAPTLDDDRLRTCAGLLGKPVPEPTPVPQPAPSPPASSGGGGALSPAVLVLLLLAAAARRVRGKKA